MTATAALEPRVTKVSLSAKIPAPPELSTPPTKRILFIRIRIRHPIASSHPTNCKGFGTPMRTNFGKPSYRALRLCNRPQSSRRKKFPQANQGFPVTKIHLRGYAERVRCGTPLSQVSLTAKQEKFILGFHPLAQFIGLQFGDFIWISFRVRTTFALACKSSVI